MWVELAARDFRKNVFPAYFVPFDDAVPIEDQNKFYIIVAVPETIRASIKYAWRRLVQNEPIYVELFNVQPNPPADGGDPTPDSKWYVKSMLK
jgi:hypothetical protein